jgi:hypothetical protein
LFQWRDLFVLLLFNKVSKISFHFIKAWFKLAEAFIEETSHTSKQISYLLRQCGSERGFELWFHTCDNLFGVPLVHRVGRYECVLKFHEFSEEDLNFFLRCFALIFNNFVISEYLIDCVNKLKKSLGDLILNYVNFEYACIF